MTEALQETPAAEPVPTKTAEQHMSELNAWLTERGLTLVPIAIGRKSGYPSPIADFMPDTHLATFELRPRQP